MILFWAKKHGLNDTDAADLVQDVLATLVSKLPAFEYDAGKRFRVWLHTITVNRARDWHRRQPRERFAQLSAFIQSLSSSGSHDVFEETEYRNFLMARIRHVIETEFEETTWRAFWLSAAEGQTAAEIAQNIGISINAVRLAKFRVIKRLRAEFGELFD